MNTRKATKQIRLQYWAGIIKECQSSGQKTKDWIIEHNITHDAYYYWLREVKRAALSNVMESTIDNKNKLVEISSPMKELSMVESTYESDYKKSYQNEYMVLHSGNISVDIPLSNAYDVLPLLIKELRNA
ncbi:hypothetical protein BXO88_10630 [Oribacterium sp. C9]|uniref:IS66 family insertion sequence element accessory protein TnpA n=1 Tax=Oribacterium sp. C9 TaxID=1943579 RepID=UPI00098EBBE9|nr:hypothetical protein [Oribacterium sp. C9]OON85706.1 hypothetical protein BXO88_10630 [Oribacterium sp. C9]